jgi:hypothetical protein
MVLRFADVSPVFALCLALPVAFGLATGRRGAPAMAVRPMTSFVDEPLPFDYVVNPGEMVILDTSSMVLTDKHGQVRVFERGKFDFDSFVVGYGAFVQGQGPNALRFFVENHVQISGTIRVDGLDGKNLTLSGFIPPGPVAGGLGVCGGGNGGTSNPGPVSLSTIGGNGFGPGQSLDAGGRGGESALVGLSTSTGQWCNEPEDRHPAGGGGGSHLTAGERGFDGTNGAYLGMGTCWVANGVSAVDPTREPWGGAEGPTVVNAVDPIDDFAGTRIGSSGVANAGSTHTLLVATGTPFTAADVGRFVDLYKTVGAWEEGSGGCSSDPGSPAACPRSKHLMRVIAWVAPNGTAVLTPALPSSIAAGDSYFVYGSGQALIGELAVVKGGPGGGAGGNSITTTVLDPGESSFGKMGAPGGGGGGVLEIRCKGPVLFRNALLTASGGDGAGGASSLGLDYVGGGSGGGAGGFVLVESLTSIDFQESRVFARGGAR